MAKEKYIFRKCGFEYSAIPGQEEPPGCPECQSDETEKLEHTSLGTSGSSCGGPPKNPLFPENRTLRMESPFERLKL